MKGLADLGDIIYNAQGDDNSLLNNSLDCSQITILTHNQVE